MIHGTHVRGWGLLLKMEGSLQNINTTRIKNPSWELVPLTYISWEVKETTCLQILIRH